jgi:hypothetical protein
MTLAIVVVVVLVAVALLAAGGALDRTRHVVTRRERVRRVPRRRVVVEEPVEREVDRVVEPPDGRL